MRYVVIGLILMGRLLIADSALKSQLDNYNALFYKQGSAEAVEAVEDDLKERHTLDMSKKIPQVGNKAIEFAIKTIDGETFDLKNALKQSPVVLFWYRGGWCPYCNIQLAYYQQYHQAIKNAGGRLVGIAPEIQSMGRATQQDHEIDFELLTDTDNAIAKQYHLVYTVKAKLLSLMDERFGLDDYYSVHKQELPLTVAFVIDQSGIIRYAYIDDDFRKRAEPTEIIDVLNKLKKEYR